MEGGFLSLLIFSVYNEVRHLKYTLAAADSRVWPLGPRRGVLRPLRPWAPHLAGNRSGSARMGSEVGIMVMITVRVSQSQRTCGDADTS